ELRAVAIVDRATLGGHGDALEILLLRHLSQLGTLMDLELPRPLDDRAGADEQDHPHQRDANPHEANTTLAKIFHCAFLARSGAAGPSSIIVICSGLGCSMSSALAT